MKRKILVGLLVNLLVLAGVADAQTYRGGMPWSLTMDKTGEMKDQKVPLITTPAPDYEKCKREDSLPSTIYRLGIGVPLDITPANSGIISYLEDGSMVWRLSIRVPGALANDLYYEKFNLPKGVALYLSNANGKQIAGSFTYIDNADDYSTYSIQGDQVTLELDIPLGVRLSDIDLHITKIFASYRGGFAQALNAKYGSFGSDDGVMVPYDDVVGEGHSNTCNINAVCPPEGQTYETLKQTAAHILYVVGNYYAECSGNLVNNTAHDCTPYFLTASHCESSGTLFAANTTVFNSWKFFFNYEYPNCTGNVVGSANTDDVITGATFVSRSTHDPIVEDEPLALVGDFLLLKLKDGTNRLGTEYNAYLGGWDRNTSAPSGKYIDFSHPQGDVKKQTVFTFVQGNGNFNTNVPSTHWSAKLEKGGIEGGSSGSCLFAESSGRIIGVLSGGPSSFEPCDTQNANRSLFSKISRDWDYPEGNGDPAQRLMDHLDPGGTGAMTTNTVKMSVSSIDSTLPPTDCSGTGSAVEDIEALNNAVAIYPNPSNDGIFRLRAKLDKSTKMTINVYDVSGRSYDSYQANNIPSGELTLDLSGLPSGIYLLKISTPKATISKKVIINR